MTMKSFRNFLVLRFVVVLSAEFETFLCSLVVKIKHLGVLSQCVKNDLAHINELVHGWHDSVLFLDFLELTVGHNNQVFGV